jgi:GntR family transcriptional regulator / MocR family aminotransferase
LHLKPASLTRRGRPPERVDPGGLGRGVLQMLRSWDAGRVLGRVATGEPTNGRWMGTRANLSKLHQANPSAGILTAVEFHVSLVGRKDLTGEIYRQLRRAILDGRLPPGGRLPPTRELAARLSVSRTTVTVAYDRLAGEGFLTAHVGAGTFVSDGLPGATHRTRRTGGALRPRPFWDTIPNPLVFERAAEFDFRPGVPDARLFPYQGWRRLLAGEFSAAAVGPGHYADPAGHPGLRQAIARHLGIARGVQATAEQVVVTNGTQQAIDVVARVLLAPGDRVAVEDPCLGQPRRLLASLGAKVAGVPVDDQGLVVEAIPPRTRLVYVTPSHQYPLGMSMSLPRRLALLAWAQRHDAAIVEDDYDSEFRYGGRPIEPLQTLDHSGRVIYVGSFSKTMLATLRLGFVVAPASLHQAVRAAKLLTDWHTPLPTQAALARFIEQGLFTRHVRKMRAVYQERHQRIVDALPRQFAQHLEVVPSAVGLHLTATARAASAAELEGVLRRAAAAGVELLPLSMYAVDAPTRPGLIFGYGTIPTERIDEGLHRLRRSFEDDDD